MRRTTLSHLSSATFILLLAFFFTQCNNSATNTSETQSTDDILEGDPRKLSVYTVELKRTDIDLDAFAIDKDCSLIPDTLCYCIDTIPGDTSRLFAYIKNCGDDGTAYNIGITATLYPSQRPAIEMSDLSINPDSLQQDSFHIIGFSTATHFDALDSITFEMEWNWQGERTPQRDTILALSPCTPTECAGQ